MANTVTITVDAQTKGAEDKVSGMAGRMKKAMKGVALVAGGLTVAGGAAAALGEEYQKATNTIAAGTGASGKVLEGLNASFENVWKGVPQSAGEVSSVIADLNTELGLEGTELEDVAKAFLDVSRAMGEDAQPMIKAVADSMVQFGVPAEQTRAQLDKLTAVSQAVGVPLTQLADKVVTLGPQFQAMGFSLDEATALVGNMEAAGINSAKVMRGLNTAVKELTDEGVTDIQGGLKDMIESIQNAETDAEATTIAMDMFGESGLRFKDAIDKGTFSLDDMLTAMGNSEGKVEDLGRETETTSDKFAIMKNRMKEALTPIGNFANTIGPLVIMAPALATGISAIAASQTIMTAATWLQSAAMAALNIAMGPIGLIILGIVAAVAAAILIFKNWDKIVDFFKKTWDSVWGGIKSIFDTVVGAISGIFNSKFGWLLPGGALLKAIFFLKDNWDLIWFGIKETVKTVVNPIIGFINTIIGGVNMVIRGLNKISVTVPSWVPIFGGKSFSFNIPEIPEIGKMEAGTFQKKIKDMTKVEGHNPRGLATGGIVTRPTLAMIGEKGPEAVIPLNKANTGGITINILGPTYGFDDFEDKVGEAIVDGVRRGGFSGILATS